MSHFHFYGWYLKIVYLIVILASELKSSKAMEILILDEVKLHNKKRKGIIILKNIPLHIIDTYIDSQNNI